MQEEADPWIKENATKVALSYQEVSKKSGKIGWMFISFAVLFLLFGLSLNAYYLFNTTIEIVKIVPINIFLLAGVTLFSGLGVFHWRVSKERKDEALKGYRDFIYN